MSYRALPSIPCVHVEIAASRPPMVTAWGELSWHKECRRALLAFGARCLLISDCWSNASSGVGVEKGIWAVKCGKGKRGQAWQLLGALQDLLTAQALRDCLAARPMGSPMICPQTHSWLCSFLNNCEIHGSLASHVLGMNRAKNMPWESRSTWEVWPAAQLKQVRYGSQGQDND